MPEAILLDKVSVRYGDVAAVKECSVSIHSGETFGLLGPNGSGKTSLLKALVGQKTFQGNVSILGQDVRVSQRKVGRLVGIAPQDYSFFHDFTVEENLFLLARLYGLSGKRLEERVKELLEEFNLKRFRSKKAGELSGGFKRLLNMAVSFIHGPPVVLLDEPTVGLDPDARKTVWDSMRKLKSMGVTLVLTTHYLEEAQAFCDRIAIVFEGRILAVGSPAKLIEKHGGDAVVSAVILSGGKGFLAGLRKLSGVSSAKLEERALQVFCKPQASSETAVELVKFLKKNGIGFQSLSIKLPSLNDAFASLVGVEMGVLA